MAHMVGADFPVPDLIWAVVTADENIDIKVKPTTFGRQLALQHRRVLRAHKGRHFVLADTEGH